MAIYIMVAFVFSQVKMVGRQMDRKDREVDEEKGWRSSTWKDSTNLFALSATARLKGSSSKSLVKSATYPMILSSVEVIHDRERQIQFFKNALDMLFEFANSLICNVKWINSWKDQINILISLYLYFYTDIK